VLLDPSRDREHVRVEDDVRRFVARVLREHGVRALADRNASLDARRLTFFVERHHDHGGAVPFDAPRLLEERVLTLLERDRVHDSLPLQGLQPRFEGFPA
jgi:hypothetical protein